MHIIWWNLSSFWQLGSAQIIGVQFNRQNLNYFGLSATPFSLDTVSPGWRSDKCPQVEEYAFVYASCFSRGLRNFRIKRDWVTFESLRTRMCLAVWSRELHMGRDAEECLSENPGRETGILNPQQLLQELAPVSLSVLVSVLWPVLVSSTWAQHWSSGYESPRCQHHDASAALGCGPNGVTPTLFPPLPSPHSCLFLPLFQPS
jgi:hypothetical protein